MNSQTLFRRPKRLNASRRRRLKAAIGKAIYISHQMQLTGILIPAQNNLDVCARSRPRRVETTAVFVRKLYHLSRYAFRAQHFINSTVHLLVPLVAGVFSSRTVRKDYIGHPRRESFNPVFDLVQILREPGQDRAILKIGYIGPGAEIFSRPAEAWSAVLIIRPAQAQNVPLPIRVPQDRATHPYSFIVRMGDDNQTFQSSYLTAELCRTLCLYPIM